MRQLAAIALLALLAGCAEFSPGRYVHQHDEALIQGAAVAQVDGKGGLAEAVTGIRIVANECTVLLAEDDRSRPGWTDSGSSEVLIVEVPALRRKSSWKIAPDGARVWMWYMSAWETRHTEGAEGIVETDTADGYVWSVRVTLHARWEGHVKSEEAVDVRREFTLLPMTYEEFKGRDGDLWTR